MKVSVRAAVRDWDYLTPLLLGDVVSEKVELELDRVATLPDGFAQSGRYDAAEMSFSRFVTSVVRGARDVYGIPNFLMRSFRHRCAITRRDGPTSFAELKGARIGLTGWQDLGNIWTRAALADAGVDIADAHWFVGRLTKDHPVVDRLGGYGVPGLIEAAPGERPMVDLLAEGALDAILTPFMPGGFFDAGTDFRHVLVDYRAAERAYFARTGFVPGIHILALSRQMVERHPWLPEELSDMIDRSAALWLFKRRRYADTSPWILDELEQAASDLPGGWNASGLEANRRMIAAFLAEINRQNLAPTELAPEDLFPPIENFVGVNA